MATPKNSKAILVTPTARRELKPRKEPYWNRLAKGVAVGYFRGTNGSTWIARLYSVADGRQKKALGIADDAPHVADGVRVLTFKQACDRAERAFDPEPTKTAEEMGSKYTVAKAMDDYLRDRERVRRKSLTRTRSVVKTHILPTLGEIELCELTQRKVKTWRDSLADAKPRIRNKPDAPFQAYRDVDFSDPEVARKRQATANRIYTVFRAALNYAARAGHVESRKAWEHVTPFRETDAPKVRYLTVQDCQNLISVCPADFQALVRAALYTGCRYGELMAMRVDAYNPDSGTVHIPRSKSGKGRHIPLTHEGAAFFASLTANRHRLDHMFTHADGKRKDAAWEDSQQRYWMELACDKAKITPAIGFHILRHTYASQLAMNGTTMPVIASLLGHADTRMTEKHYGHLAPSYIADTLRANLPNFGFEAPKHGPMLVKAS